MLKVFNAKVKANHHGTYFFPLDFGQCRPRVVGENVTITNHRTQLDQKKRVDLHT